MQNNTTLNMTHNYRVCSVTNHETFLAAVRLNTYIVTSICSFIGNLLVILTVYKNNNLRTSTYYFIVSMSVSDLLYPFCKLLEYKFVFDSSLRLSKLVGNLLCKFLSFISHVSYGVSMLTLVAITVYRFSAVMFPLRARVQNKKIRILVLLLTWVIPMAMSSHFLVYWEFNEQNQRCLWKLDKMQLRSLTIDDLSLFIFLPLLIMMVLYPLIVFKLRQHKIPGNVNNIQAIIRRRKENFRLTAMLFVLTGVLLLCAGPYIIYCVLFVIRYNIHSCSSHYLKFVYRMTTVTFHPINPVIYFIFLSSFRQVLVRTHLHRIAFQPQAMKLQG